MLVNRNWLNIFMYNDSIALRNKEKKNNGHCKKANIQNVHVNRKETG